MFDVAVAAAAAGKIQPEVELLNVFVVAQRSSITIEDDTRRMVHDMQESFRRIEGRRVTLDEVLRVLEAQQPGELTACGWTPGQPTLDAA